MRTNPAWLIFVAGVASWSGPVQAGVLTVSAEDGFQQVIARYRQEGLGSADATLQGIDIDKTSVSLKLQVKGRPLTLRLSEPEGSAHPGPVRWFLIEVVEGDGSSPAAVEARRRLIGWLQDAFVDDPWVSRAESEVTVPAVMGPAMVEQVSKDLPPWSVWVLATGSILLGGALLWRP